MVLRIRREELQRARAHVLEHVLHDVRLNHGYKRLDEHVLGIGGV